MSNRIQLYLNKAADNDSGNSMLSTVVPVAAVGGLGYLGYKHLNPGGIKGVGKSLSKYIPHAVGAGIAGTVGALAVNHHKAEEGASYLSKAKGYVDKGINYLKPTPAAQDLNQIKNKIDENLGTTPVKTEAANTIADAKNEVKLNQVNSLNKPEAHTTSLGKRYQDGKRMETPSFGKLSQGLSQPSVKTDNVKNLSEVVGNVLKRKLR
jgi:hypothetical protein